MFQNSKQYLFSPFKQGSGTLLNLPEPIVDTIALTCDDTYKEYIREDNLVLLTQFHICCNVNSNTFVFSHRVLILIRKVILDHFIRSSPVKHKFLICFFIQHSTPHEIRYQITDKR